MAPHADATVEDMAAHIIADISVSQNLETAFLMTFIRVPQIHNVSK